MILDKRLLEILRCPASGQPLKPMSSAQLQLLNEAIAAGSVQRDDGTPVVDAFDKALLTQDHVRVYPVDNGIPVMLVAESIQPGSLFTTAD